MKSEFEKLSLSSGSGLEELYYILKNNGIKEQIHKGQGLSSGTGHIYRSRIKNPAETLI